MIKNNKNHLFIYAIILFVFVSCNQADRLMSLVVCQDIVQWRISDSLYHEVAGDLRVGQAFTSDCDGLSQIDLYIIKKPTSAPTKLIWHLQDSLGAENDLASGSIDISSMVPRGYVPIKFKPLVTSSQSKHYYFYIENPVAPQNQGIIVPYGLSRYTHSKFEGQQYINGQPNEGNLFFCTFCTVQQKPIDVFNQIILRFKSDLVFTVFYIFLLVGIVLGLIFLANSRKK